MCMIIEDVVLYYKTKIAEVFLMFKWLYKSCRPYLCVKDMFMQVWIARAIIRAGSEGFVGSVV